MLNIIITGIITDKLLLLNNIKKLILLRKKKVIQQIIISTYNDENLDIFAYRFLKKNNIHIIESNKKKYKLSLLHQKYTLKKSISSIKNKNNMILKLRTDTYFKNKDIIKISKLNFASEKNSVFHKKIWVPWFEITKPLYIGDEVFVISFKDLQNILSKKKYYGLGYLTHGITHINWFLPSLIKRYKKLKNFNIYGNSFHFNFKRKIYLKKIFENKNYLYLLFLYYNILKKEFIVGFNLPSFFRLKNKTINFYDNQKKLHHYQNSLRSFFEENNMNIKYSGLIICRDTITLNKLIKTKEMKKLKNFKFKKNNINNLIFKAPLISLLFDFLSHFYNYIYFRLKFLKIWKE